MAIWRDTGHVGVPSGNQLNGWKIHRLVRGVSEWNQNLYCVFPYFAIFSIYGNVFFYVVFHIWTFINTVFFLYFYGSHDIRIAIFDDTGAYRKSKSMLRPFSEQLQTLQDVRWLALCSPFLFGDQNCNDNGGCKILAKFVCNYATWFCFSDQNHTLNFQLPLW